MAVNVTLPDGTVKEYPDGTNALQVAESISKGLAKVVVAAKVNGEIWDFHRPLPARCTVLLIKEDQPEGLDVIRHSAAHIMAGAVRRIYGDRVKFGFGPAIEDGFYYDMEFPEGVKITEDELSKIEAECRKIIEANYPFERKDLPKAEVIAKMSAMQQGYKVETLEKDIKDPTASIYTDGDFTDLCEGPHVPSTGRVRAIKLTKTTGAYWRGDQKNRMLTRLYGTAWHSQKALDEYVKRVEEAKKRDHRKLGQELELFMFHDWSPGAVFFLPRGAVIYNELVAFIREEYRKRGFQEVVTPQLYNKGLWELSGHWSHYQENMFILDIDEEKFSLKPMNCPSHVLMFKHRRRSYRELPLRIADFCPLHRNEVRGVLSGMTRVRKFEQDDAHIFCTEEQIESEISGQIDFVNQVYAKTFKMPFVAKLSTRPEKFLGKVETWNAAEAALEKALRANGVEYRINAGDGAFYGPKIDFDMKDAIGRPWQLSTIQLDFQLPARMGCEYEGKDGLKVPVMIHRAILGSLERFIGVLVEHYGGEFPLWLAPVQAAVLAVTPLTDELVAYARKVQAKLLEAGLRSEIDLSEDNISAKIKSRELQKLPYMAVVGAKELAAGTVAVREHKKGNRGVLPLDDFVSNLRRDVAAKTV
ncbi:MAG TPA: threonine--tRNA ligase [Planctomycetota bacterium]|nr:threonine--tRNA ligase [Planctomycetota bacterium]